MKCCISSCKMYSDRRSDEMKGVTFHSLPSDETVRKQWLLSIGRKKWNPSKHSKICSNHFNKEDFYITRKGFRKIKIGAVPRLKLDSSEPNVADPNSQVTLEPARSQEDKFSPYQHNQLLKLKTLQNKHRRLLKRYTSLEQLVKNMRTVPNGQDQSQDREIKILHKRNIRLRDKNKTLIGVIKKLKRCVNNQKTTQSSVCEVCNISLVFVSSDNTEDSHCSD